MKRFFFFEDVIGKSHAVIKERTNNYFYKYVLARGSFYFIVQQRTNCSERNIFSVHILPLADFS
jgi:hypothetical protein